ncbi:MAG: hypothetical protein AB8H80_10690 [Planctomycetota bacterium]
MKRPLGIAVLALSAGTAAPSLFAQQVTATAAWLAPVDLTVVDGSLSESQQYPAGPLVGQQQRSVAQGGSISRVNWVVGPSAQDDEIYLGYGIQGAAGQQSTATAMIGLHEVLFTLTAPSPRAVLFESSLPASASGNASLPLFEVDFGNDGSIERTATGLNQAPASATIGPVPYEVRVRCQATAQHVGGSLSSFVADFALTVRPDNNLSIQRNVLGCSQTFSVTPAFSYDGFRMHVNYTAPGGVWAVVGFGLQPVLLPSSLPNCVLLPRPDVVLPLPAPAGGIDVPIPPSLRPLTLYAQAVPLPLSGLPFATDGYRVRAF